VIIRRARPADSHEIADVWLRSRKASVPAIPPPVHSDADVRDWFSRVVLPTREVWVACSGEDIVALLVLDGEWLDQLYVAPEFTGQGVGGQLVETAKGARPGGLQLWTFQRNAGARRFYERHGFMACEETSGQNEEGAPDVRYVWNDRFLTDVVSGGEP
jgi:GNAT superfamily N-acetyltransferase